MVTKRSLTIFYIASLFFILVELISVIKGLTFIAVFLPIVALVVYWALFSLDKLMLFIVLCTPLSINIFNVPGLQLGQIGIGMALPTEPLMFGVMLLFFMHISFSGYDKQIVKHPVTIIIICSLLWMLITSFTSTMPFVSFKYLLERSWGVVTFYFLGIFLFKKYKNVINFQWLYTGGLVFVTCYTIVRQISHHFSEKSAHVAVTPFYNDHTAYGALLAMFIPVVGGLMFLKKDNAKLRPFAPFVFALFLIAVGLSFSRAAWLSLVGAIFMFVLMLMRVKLKWILSGLGVGVILFFVYQTRIIMQLQRNTSEVSQNLSTEIESISNISSDASNRERLNRWSCAFRMFRDKPLLGFGPGTYMFNYAPYQLSYMKTIISTDLGTGGNAHSEYLGPLSEEGVPGFLIVIALAISVVAMSFRLFYNSKDREIRILVISIFLGLLTYFIHGFMNNFLDTDKAAVPFWGFIGMLVAIDLNFAKPEKAATANVSESGNIAG